MSWGCADEAYMAAPTLGLDINIKHTNLQTFYGGTEQRATG